MNPVLKYLTLQGVTHALENSGYAINPGEYTSAKFDGFNSSGDAVYVVKFYNENIGMLDNGRIYVSIGTDGNLQGEF